MKKKKTLGDLIQEVDDLKNTNDLLIEAHISKHGYEMTGKLGHCVEDFTVHGGSPRKVLSAFLVEAEKQKALYLAKQEKQNNCQHDEGTDRVGPYDVCVLCDKNV